MKLTYDRLSENMSRLTTHTYSTSFSLGIRFIDKKLRNSIYAIYGFVRIADEIVDSFENYDRGELLDQFRRATYEAIDKRISVNPILHSFQQAVHTHRIESELIETFLESMRMDLEKVDYTPETYDRYILGSAEVVGLMCLRVFTERDAVLYDSLKPYAMKLGSAFQKVNFLRDLKSDYHELGRCYFPNVDITRFDSDSKKNIEYDIELDFVDAYKGISKLPSSSRMGVYLAYVYYYSLFRKIKKTPARQVMNKRIRINNGQKLGLMLNCLVCDKLRLV